MGDRWYKDIITSGISDEYPNVLFTIGKAEFSVYGIHRTISAL